MLQILHDCEFIGRLPERLIHHLESISRELTYAPGDTLFKEGAVNRHFHVISEGHVRLEMHVPQRGRVPILTAGRGEITGWSAVIGNSIMTATAVALDHVKTVVFDGERLKQLCEDEHDIGYHIMRQLAATLSRRLLATRLQLLELFGDTHIQSHLSEGDETVDQEC